MSNIMITPFVPWNLMYVNPRTKGRVFNLLDFPTHLVDVDEFRIESCFNLWYDSGGRAVQLQSVKGSSFSTFIDDVPYFDLIRESDIIPEEFLKPFPS